MIISWKFPINQDELTREELKQLSSIIKEKIGFDSEEVSIQGNRILASPELGRRMFGIQTFRMALYDLSIYTEKGNIVFRFRYFTLYFFSMALALLLWAVSQSIIGFAIGLVFFSFIFIVIKWIENRIQKFKIASEIKQILD